MRMNLITIVAQKDINPLRMVSIFTIYILILNISSICYKIFKVILITDSSSTSEWQSDWTSSDELDRDGKKYKRKVLSRTKNENADKPGSPSLTNANANSDSSDDQSEKCPICLIPFKRQQVGTPSACDHCFCLECLLEWSKNINTCPVDRIPFTTIVVRDHFDGKVTGIFLK